MEGKVAGPGLVPHSETAVPLVSLYSICLHIAKTADNHSATSQDCTFLLSVRAEMRQLTFLAVSMLIPRWKLERWILCQAGS